MTVPRRFLDGSSTVLVGRALYTNFSARTLASSSAWPTAALRDLNAALWAVLGEAGPIPVRPLQERVRDVEDRLPLAADFRRDHFEERPRLDRFKNWILDRFKNWITYVQDPFPLRVLLFFEGSNASTFAEFQHIATSFDVLSEIATQKFRREQLRTSLSKFGGP